MKRQRSVSVSNNPGSGGWNGGGGAGYSSSVNQPSALLGYGAFSPQSLSEINPFMQRSQSVSSSQGSAASSLQNMLPSWGLRPSSSSQSGSLPRASETDVGRGAGDDVEFTTTVSNPMVIPRSSNLTAKLRQSESQPDRSKLAVPPASDIASTPMSTASGSVDARVSSSSSNQNPQSPPGASAPAPATAPVASNKSAGQWRDKYVMKFSGWKQSAPDTGLPPSLQSQGGQKTSTGLGFRYPSNAAATSSVGDGRRGTISTTDSTDESSSITNDHIMERSERSGSLHGLDSVDYTAPSTPKSGSLGGTGVPIVPTTSSSDVQKLRDDSSNRSNRKASGSF